MKLKFTVPDSVKAGLSVTVPESLKPKIVAMLNRSIAYVEITEDGHLVFTMTDGSVEDLGLVVGKDGKDGVNGISVTHKWDGTVLTITSASGTSSADLKGEKGDPTGVQTINGLEPDENGNIKLAAGYDKIVTPYQKYIDTTLNFTTEMAVLVGLGSNQIKEGNEYIVTWRNTSYVCTAYFYNGSVLLGNSGLYGGPNTGEPFVFEVLNEDSCIVTKNSSAFAFIPITVETEEKVEIVKIPKTYLPDNIGAVQSVNGNFPDENGNVVIGGVQFEPDETLTLKNGILSVNTTTKVEENNTLPITSAAVNATVGNIEVILGTI